jgi:hypothetical protein
VWEGMIATFSKMEYLLRTFTGSVEVRLRIAQPLRIFETTRCKYSTGSKKKMSPGGSIRVSLQCIYRGFFIVTSTKNISDKVLLPSH